MLTHRGFILGYLTAFAREPCPSEIKDAAVGRIRAHSVYTNSCLGKVLRMNSTSITVSHSGELVQDGGF